MSSTVTVAAVVVILNHHELTQLAGSRLPGLHAYYFYALLALIMPALFDFARRFPLDRWMGEMSYPIYLIHWPVIWIWPKLPSVASIAITLLLSIALVAFVTAPLDKWRERRAKQPARNSDPHPISCQTP
jgi:peptidoglycan/LPS O-acetylase OafA/YrhL